MANSDSSTNGYSYETFGLKWSDANKWNWTQYNAPLNINIKKDQTAFEVGTEHKNLEILPKIVYLYKLFREEISSSEYDSPEYGYCFPFFQQDLSKISVTSPFGKRTHPVTGQLESYHKGVDLAGPQGTPIHCIADGTVVVNDFQDGGAGNWIKIKHNDGRYSLYMHMRDRSPFQSGSVKKGDIIGYIGTTGGSTGPHLHFQINNSQDEAKNPCIYFTRLANKLDGSQLA